MASAEDRKREDVLLEMAAQGNRIGLEYLVHTYQDLAFAVAVKIVMNKEDAEEVVQDSFMKAFGALRNFRRTSKFSTWLYRIVYNTALTKRKSNPVQAVVLDERIHPEPAIMVENDGHQEIAASEQQRFVNKALGQLDPLDFIIVNLYYRGDKDIASICEIVDMTKSNVKMRLMRSRKQLESELQQMLKTEVKDLL